MKLQGITKCVAGVSVFVLLADGLFAADPPAARKTLVARAYDSGFEMDLRHPHGPLHRPRNLSSGLQRRPNVAFVSFEPWAKDRPIPDEDAWDVIPNLAVEVVSRTNEFDEVLEKVSEYFAAGVERVWVVIPSRRQVYVYRSETDLRVLTRSEHLDGESVLPGFRCSVAEVLEA
jgi:hypothetical protein